MNGRCIARQILWIALGIERGTGPIQAPIIPNFSPFLTQAIPIHNLADKYVCYYVIMINQIEREKSVLEFVVKTSGVTAEEIKSPSRTKRFVEARSLYCYILRSFGWSYPDIGRYANRDHTSVMHLVKLFEKNSEKERIDEEIKNLFGEESSDAIHSTNSNNLS